MQIACAHIDHLLGDFCFSKVSSDVSLLAVEISIYSVSILELFCVFNLNI